jgi:HlyD family secretion protein
LLSRHPKRHFLSRSTPRNASNRYESARPKKKRKPIWRRWYVILGVIVLLFIIVSSLLGKREKPIPVTTEKAVKKTIVQTVSATGKIQPELEVKISPEVAGEIIELPVEDGMAIKKGSF